MKLTSLKFNQGNPHQAENFRKMLFAVAGDVRVLLIKFAERLHSMRHIDLIDSVETRKNISLEVMEVYVPLAERIGLEKLKVEMQDLTFGVLHPEIKKSITDKLIGISTSMQDMIPGIKESLELLLKSYHVVAQVHGRVKAPYSAWVKTRDKQLPLEELLDIFGFRIITDTTANCYRVLSILHNHYTPVLECFQDYIMHPKQNGYQSLHTVVVTPSKQKIEVQIRTFHMHEIAEVGIAAHWTYKQGYRDTDSVYYQSIRELIQHLQYVEENSEFLKRTQLSLYNDDVFCFTPKGDLVRLPKGSTVLDFAYAVHSSIGDTCIGAKIRGEFVPASNFVRNVDAIEVITSKDQVPSEDWLKIVVTPKAKISIKRFLRDR